MITRTTAEYRVSKEEDTTRQLTARHENFTLPLHTDLTESVLKVSQSNRTLSRGVSREYKLYVRTFEKEFQQVERYLLAHIHVSHISLYITV